MTANRLRSIFTAFVAATSLAATVLPAFANELTAVRFAEPRTVLEFRYAGNLDGFPIMSLEELQMWNEEFSDATDTTIVPAWTPIYYDQSSGIVQSQ